MNPYRQPQKHDERPADPTRIVLIVAGTIAALIAAAAIVVGVSDRFSKPPTVETPPPSPASLPELPNIDAGPHAIVDKWPTPQPRIALPDDRPLSFVASSGGCYGNCLEHTTRIDEAGRVTLTMSRLHGPTCARTNGQTVARDDLAALAAHARSLHMETMSASYIHMTDVQGYTTEVSGGGRRLSIHHLKHDDAGADASAQEKEEAAIDGLRRHIERVAGTDTWVKTCKRTNHKPDDDIDALLDSR